MYHATPNDYENPDWSNIRQEIDFLLRERSDLVAMLRSRDSELSFARHRVDRLVKILTGIHAAIYPPTTMTSDGKRFVFAPNNPHEYLQAISDRIRAIPDEIEKALRDETAERQP